MTDPLAYLLTWHTYGTWLQGDAKGSVNRLNREYGRDFVRTNLPRQQAHRDRMSSDPISLNEGMRSSVQTAIVSVCEHRGWKLLALHVRTNHVHAVVAAGIVPERILNDFKSYATRSLRQRGLVGPDARIWSRHGSTRYLWKGDDVAAAIDYAVNRQGTALLPEPLATRNV